MRESTRILIEKHGWRYDRAIHNLIYFRYYYPYVRVFYHSLLVAAKYLHWCKPINPILRMAVNRYHSKIISAADVTKILTLDEDVAIASPKSRQAIPFKYAHAILFKDHDYIAVMDCPCKKTLHAPPETINSCIVVGKGTAYFWTDQLAEKYNARRISQVEALDIVKGFRKMGYVTMAFFKVATGGSTGVICNCRPESCVSLQATRFMRKFDPSLTMNADAGYAVRRDATKCRSCGICRQYCHFEALDVCCDDKTWRYDPVRCTGCELCVEQCPEGALSMYIDPGKPMPLDMDLLRTS